MHLGMSMGMHQEQRIEQRQEMTLEQRLALELALKLKMTLKQVLKLYPQLTLLHNLEAEVRALIKKDESVVHFLEKNPSSYELKHRFPVFRDLFDQAHTETYRLSLGMRMSQTLSQTQSLTQTIALPPTNWSFVDAYEEGKKTSDFPKKKIEGFDRLSLVDRLKAIDAANEIFRFAYVDRREQERGREVTRYYRVPLLRGTHIDPEEIAERISKESYRKAKKQVEVVSSLDRIARAIPYTELHFNIKEFVEQNGASLDDVVIIGIDRGGRVPARIVREALGKKQAYFLKVDQGDSKLDNKRLIELGKKGVLKNKFLLFVDSTVDSGRQIKTLQENLSREYFKSLLGHKGWGVVGSNEQGFDHPYHKNINWGLDPDQSFEDNPLLMGVDYGNSNTEVKAVPSKTSTTIRSTISDVTKGMVFDFSISLREEKKTKDISALINSITRTKKWKSIGSAPAIVSEVPLVFYEDPALKRIKIAVSGSSHDINLRGDYLEEFGRVISPYVNILYTGTEIGGPGSVMRGVARSIDEVVVIRPEDEVSRIQCIKSNAGISNLKISFQGKRDNGYRKIFSQKVDAHIVLDGKDGTLAEALYSIEAGKPTFVLSSGKVGRYLAMTPQWKEKETVIFCDNFREMAQQIRAYTLKRTSQGEN